MILAARPVIGRAPEHRQLVRLGKRQRSQEDRVDHTEDRAIGADPKREGENGDETEAGRLQEDAESVAKVIHAALHR